MFNDFNDLINQTSSILDKIIYVSKISFDEYKLLEKLGFCTSYSSISDLPNNDAVQACECINNNKLDEIENKAIHDFVCMNSHRL